MKRGCQKWGGAVFITAAALLVGTFMLKDANTSPNSHRKIDIATNKTLNIDTITDPDTSIPVKRYYIEGANVHGGYVNNSMYINDNEFYFLSDCNGSENIYRINTCTECIEKLTDESDKDTYTDVNSFGLTPYIMGDALYYAIDNHVYQYDANSRDTKSLLELEEGEVLWAPLYVTNDGKYMSTTITKENISYVTRINLETKELDCLQSPFVGSDNPVANHAIIHPENPELIMFAHEGSWVMDRVWFWRLDTGEVYHLFDHPEYTEMGHEIWTNDAQNVCIIQYGSPARGISSGINFIDMDGNYTDQILTDGFYFNHVTISPDGRYLALDTLAEDENDKTWIVLYDRVKKVFATVTSYEMGNHPAHAHPFFSPSGQKIMFNNLVDGRIELNEIDIRDIAWK